ncbi:hypothetical protein MSP7336_00266 [Mycobacterium shimoidei]|uniref:Uncharacterized protein n=1 Tax=Mycobacterium shimoidei TaxID=29313 RepID=A0A375YTF8_MYCSH|nr:hypothetical protein MSP7336_00266 [Mycobacterium shimoidei]
MGVYPGKGDADGHGGRYRAASEIAHTPFVPSGRVHAVFVLAEPYIPA